LDIAREPETELKKSSFPTPQDAEAAFYEALERADLEAMMEVWSEDEDVSCIHPGGPRIAGIAQVRENWSQIFKSGQRLQVHLSDQIIVSGMLFSVHSLHENILVRSGQGEGTRTIVVATNVYQRTGSGWRMLLHHGSPAPAPVVHRDAPLEAPKVLH
jgi:ketosteroid isomerase-like protein